MDYQWMRTFTMLGYLRMVETAFYGHTSHSVWSSLICWNSYSYINTHMWCQDL